MASRMVLDSRSDWHIWFWSVELIATGGRADVWIYIDPSKSEEQTPAVPTRPTEPQETANKEQSKAIFKSQWRIYKQRIKQYHDIKEELGKILLHILATVSKDNMIIIGNIDIDEKNTDAVYKILRALRARVAPSKCEEKARATNEYKLAFRYDKRVKVETWLLRWEIAYREAVRLNLPEVEGTRPIFEFLKTVEPLQPAHVAAARDHLYRWLDENPGKGAPPISRFLQMFRHANISIS